MMELSQKLTALQRLGAYLSGQGTEEERKRLAGSEAKGVPAKWLVYPGIH